MCSNLDFLDNVTPTDRGSRIATIATATAPQQNEVQVCPERSLAQLEKAAKTSNDKMLQLADALMLGFKGWPRDPYRACSLYRAAAWGCSEEEEMAVRYDSIPVGPPEALLAACGTNIAMLRQKAGIPLDKPCMPRIWMVEGLKNDENMEALRQICFWVSQALKLHGHVTPLALTMAQGIQDIRFLNDTRVSDEIKEYCEQIMKAYQCRQVGAGVDFELLSN